MGRMKKLDKAERQALRTQLYEDIEAQRLSVPEAVRAMRAITGLTQADFAERIAGVSLPTLKGIEQGKANPTLETLEHIGRAFGLEVGFVRRTE